VTEGLPQITLLPTAIAPRSPLTSSCQSSAIKALASLAVITSYRRGQEICGQGNQADYWYRVVSGVAKRSVVRLDGRRQILGLLLPGEFFGFVSSGEYDFTAEALAKASVERYLKHQLETLATVEPEVGNDLRKAAFAEISHLQAQLLILGRITARAKVGSFILQMAERLSGKDANCVTLPISRYDIGDFLALSPETVSRALTNLKCRGVIRLLGTRRIKIIDRDALDEKSSELQS
jgi:CRP-like cAMP-binding protein